MLRISLLLLPLLAACGAESPVSGSLLLRSTGETVWLVDGLALDHDGGTTLELVDRLGASCREDPATWSEGIFHVVYAVHGEAVDSCYVYAHRGGRYEYLEDLPGCRVDIEAAGGLVTGSVDLGERGASELHGVLHCGFEPWS